MTGIGKILQASQKAKGPGETLPCAHCKKPIHVAQSTIEFAGAMNRLRAQQVPPIPLVKKSDGISLCPPCYEKHKAALTRESDERAEREQEQWRLWLHGDITDQQFLAGSSNRPEAEKQMAAAKTRMATKRAGSIDRAVDRALAKSRKQADDDVFQKRGGE